MSKDYKLLNKVPKYYRTSTVMQVILNADEAALGAAEDTVDAVDAQCLIATATEDSISRWEAIFGIPGSEDSLERRRERVLAKKRGGGSGTIAHLKNVISSFSNGEVEIRENYAKYTIEIEFVGVKGIPPYMDDVKSAIDEIIPAHIAYTIKITYNTYGMLSAYTHEQLHAYTHEGLRTEEIS